MAGCKFDCGDMPASACIPYTGKDLTILENPTDLACDANINDVIEKLDAALKTLIDGNDLTGLDKECLVFDPATVTPAELHQIEITAICENLAAITALTDQFNDLDIGLEVVTIDLPDCLAPDVSLCTVGTNEYQLITILNLFAAMLCDHETRISNLEP